MRVRFFALALVVTMGCTPTPPVVGPGTGSGTTSGSGSASAGAQLDATQQVLATLKQAAIAEQSDPFKDRAFAPSISSIDQRPSLALGAVYVREANEGKKCDSDKAEDFTYERLLDIQSDSDDCKIATLEPVDLGTSTQKGGVDSKIKYIVGDTAVNASFAYELKLSQPVSVAFESPSKCITAADIEAIKLPSRTCTVNYIVGAVLTEVSYREYFDSKGSTSNAIGMINIGGSAYYTTGQTVNKYFMTVDRVALSQYFTAGADGFLAEKAQKSALKHFSLADKNPHDLDQQLLFHE